MNLDRFDCDQYLAEHSDEKCTVVIAGAGSGKTKVMIDHVLYLLATQTDLKPSEVAMITLTNAATDSMRHKFQTILLNRFNATGDLRFVEMMEKQAQMTISTIDSFLYARLKLLGPDSGFSPDLSIRGMKNEVKSIVNVAVQEYFESHELSRELTMSDMVTNIREYLYLLLRLGFSYDDISKLTFDGGGLVQVDTQALMEQCFKVIRRDYSEAKEKKDALDVEDLLPTFIETIRRLDRGNNNDTIKHIIIDEFQDTNKAQIEAVSALIRIRGSKTFVVGDGNQGIYRFRGASNEAFKDFMDMLLRHGLPVSGSPIILRKNYRSSPELFNSISPIFEEFGRREWLSYPSKILPFSMFPGKALVISA